ncbi:OmpA family protein [Candidatus Frankia alpina]|uniref:OmpA family protein n=1 Tax=Candidatus Frankia alpina TaxID=2699483 RepID=A0A4S5ES17_9ACTN|nr:OmpA family protein [Candidatus Frankia alpina]THJ74840.1 OmpA family protein [Candidatus Frankia alpina]
MSPSLAARLHRPRPVAFAVSLVLAWLLLALIAFALRRGPIQDDLAARATAAVRAAGGVHAQVRIEGREAIVSGRFPNAAAAEQARVSAAVSGTTSARLGGDVVIATRPAKPLVLAVAGGGLAVTATVPDGASRAALLAAVADAAGGTVRGQVLVDPAAVEPPVEAVAALATALRGVAGEHSATVSGTTVALTGGAPDEAARRRLGAAVLAATSAAVPGATLANHVAVTRAGSGSAARPGRAPAASQQSGSSAPGGTATDSGTTATGSSGTLAAVRAALDGHGVTFPVAGARLTPSARACLDKVAEALRGGDLAVLVGGHTDISGPPALNQALSLNRAQTAADYLTGRGVPADLVRAAGFGAREPIGNNRTPQGRAANRRIEIIPLPSR